MAAATLVSAVNGVNEDALSVEIEAILAHARAIVDKKGDDVADVPHLISRLPAKIRPLTDGRRRRCYWEAIASINCSLKVQLKEFLLQTEEALRTQVSTVILGSSSAILQCQSLTSAQRLLTAFQQRLSPDSRFYVELEIPEFLVWCDELTRQWEQRTSVLRLETEGRHQERARQKREKEEQKKEERRRADRMRAGKPADYRKRRG